MSALCRQCGEAARDGERRCGRCGSPRLVAHDELFALPIAHIDCDAFYASVEKRDDPGLRDKPVIVGGGRRGVVSAACYVARTYGVRSAMPMFKARQLCPDAVVVPPDMARYAAVGREVRALMREATPLVEPLSIDEAFLDLAGTERLHGAPPAVTLARLIRRIETEIGVTASVGLSYNKFLAKVASDLDKPRGFAAIGRAEARDFLARQRIGIVWGVGQSMQAKLERDGLTHLAQLQEMDEAALIRRYGSIGGRLARFARGEDERKVTPERAAKSISAETTFESDHADPEALRGELWRLAEKVAARLKEARLTGVTVTLKLKSADFRSRTRNRTLAQPTQLADAIWHAAADLLEGEADGRTAFRLIGVGLSGLGPAAEAEADPAYDLLDLDARKRARTERAIDSVRAKLGAGTIGKGRGFRPKGGSE